MIEEPETNQKNEVTFKSKKKGNHRNFKQYSSRNLGEEDNQLLSKIVEMKDLQKLRQRPNGINVIGLTSGKRITTEEAVVVKDQNNCRIGGMLQIQSLKKCEIKDADDAYNTGIGTQFSAETNIRDQDEEMMKYIEKQVNKQKGHNITEQNKNISKKYLTPEEAALFALPAHLRHTSVQKSEEMLSNQMLSGIPEVDLGIEAKIKNIEATEEAKQKMIQDKKKQKVGLSFVPVNIATNFAVHNDRYNSDTVSGKRKKHSEPINSHKREDISNKRDPKKATDDFYYDKFRNKYRKH